MRQRTRRPIPGKRSDSRPRHGPVLVGRAHLTLRTPAVTVVPTVRERSDAFPPASSSCARPTGGMSTTAACHVTCARRVRSEPDWLPAVLVDVWLVTGGRHTGRDREADRSAAGPAHG